ncbi:hypothetical protein V8E36_000696 [Tilletia maclaganii]
MLRCFLTSVFCALLLSRTSAISVTVPLHLANISTLLHPNSTLSHAAVDNHIRHIQHRHCLAQRESHYCRQIISSLYRRHKDQVRVDVRELGGPPVIPIFVGGQALLVVFDTASALSLVGPPRYFPDRSRSAQYVGAGRTDVLPNGRTSEVVSWTDIVSIGHFNVISTFSRSLDRVFDPSITAADGILAFSKHDSASPHPAPPIYVMQQASLLDNPVFAFSVPRAERFGGPLETEGKLTIGGIDRDAYNSHLGQLRYSPVSSAPRYQNLWALRGTINGHAGTMILDTGSSFIVMPMRLAVTLFSDLGLRSEDSGTSLAATYRCDDPPKINIRIGSTSVRLHDSSVQFGAEDNGWCAISIIGVEQADITLGKPFFENVYTAIKLNGRIGLRAI